MPVLPDIDCGHEACDRAEGEGDDIVCAYGARCGKRGESWIVTMS